MMIKVLKGYCGFVGVVVMAAGKAAALLMPLLAGVVAYEVFSRYFLGQPTIWAFDLSLFMFGYIAALGGAWAQQQRAHINVDILYLSVSRKTRALFNLISYALAIFFLLVIAEMGLVKLEEALEYDYRRQSEWAPPMFHFWAMLVLACVLFIAQMSRDMLAEGYHLISGQHLLEQE
ncbi:TRAP transporter small permease subunit [Marinobacterium jannaschii]|uniref:TRAP transporter small permease subunit n=1 Tax=Marinobacterium jannaschii TaxID=64970 RepID=UPI00048788C6|nr:TRAP transporter small permease [Marinobacterium jannaschii]